MPLSFTTRHLTKKRDAVLYKLWAWKSKKLDGTNPLFLLHMSKSKSRFGRHGATYSISRRSWGAGVQLPSPKTPKYLGKIY